MRVRVGRHVLAGAGCVHQHAVEHAGAALDLLVVEPSLMVLAGTDTRWLLAAEGAAALRDGTVAALVVGDRDLPAVLAALGDAAPGKANAQVAVRATVRGFNYSRGRFVTLSILEPRR